MAKKNEAVQEEQVESPKEDTNISLADLQLLHRIVDLASSRGAFRGAELTQVGAVYDKLTTFLQQVVEAQEAAEAEAGQKAEAQE